MTTAKFFGFDAVAQNDSRALILGSFPGPKSLECGQYYANPRNQFWPIMDDLFGIARDLPYENRIIRLQRVGIAVCDVCRSAYREGSLDAKLVVAEPNDFEKFLEHHRCVEAVCFTGVKAQKLYKRKVLPKLGPDSRGIQYLRLPSTSPAYAALPYQQKLSQWKAALNFLLLR